MDIMSIYSLKDLYLKLPETSVVNARLICSNRNRVDDATPPKDPNYHIGAIS